jgi:hypothetical protein
MAQLRIRIELKRPAKGIEMSKLSTLAQETQKFLRMVAEDIGLNPNEGTWVAQDFYNQGIGFNAEYQYGEVDQDLAFAYLRAVDNIANVSAESQWAVRGVRPLTIVQSARLAEIADEGETVRLGLLNGDDQHIEWRSLTKEKAAAVIEHYDEWAEYRGMLQGVIHTIFKEANPPYFTLRDFASRQLVRCEFDGKDWEKLYLALERKDAAVFVAGWMRTRRLDREIAVIRVERVQGTKPLRRDQLEEFFGAAPGWTGDLTTEEFLRGIRDDGEE